MCGGVPKVQKRNPKAEAERAANDAAIAANAESAARTRRLRQSSLLAGGYNAGSAQTLLAQAYGKQVLGA